MLPEHLFVSSDGNLYDTRKPMWPNDPLRRHYEGHFPITGLNEVKAALREGPHTSLGGYPVYFRMHDGEPLALKTVKDNWREVTSAMLHHDDTNWIVDSIQVNYENDDLYDAHTGERIEAAYEDD